ncbi:hypothetical protein ACF1AE_29075 [Streptomyces sp. NPDC014986]|uniref:hypothetical protein n=1 Tax=Streptomyces sp. NPDC014986 TaxID=3364934 RepID=UPI0036F6BDA0
MVVRPCPSWPAGEDVHAYFDDDPGGAAVTGATVFARAARTAGLRVPRAPARTTRPTAGRTP